MVKSYAWDELHTETTVTRRLPGALFALCQWKAGESVEEHRHEGLSFVVVISGKHQWLDEQGRIHWSVPGAWYSDGGAGEVNTHQACSTDIEAVVIRFLPEAFEVPVDEVSNKVLHTQAGQRIAQRVQSELLRPTAGGNYVLLSCLTDLIARFINTARKEEVSHTHAVVRQALDLLNKQFAAPLSLDEVARSVGTNRSTLGRLFRHHVGVSVGEYVRDRRLEWAYLQLTDTNTKIAVIAAAAGFADQAHFCRCFKTRYGVTPSSLRSVPALLAPGA